MQTEYFVDVASDYKCDFILFPEIFTTQLLSFLPDLRPGLSVRKLSEFTPQYLEHFSKLSIKYNINIIGGSHFTVENDHLFNISYLFRRDGTLGKQYKLHITPNERRWWGIEHGAQILFVPFCTDERYAYLRVRYCAQARCIENHLFVVIAGSVLNWQDQRRDLYEVRFKKEL